MGIQVLVYVNCLKILFSLEKAQNGALRLWMEMDKIYTDITRSTTTNS